MMRFANAAGLLALLVGVANAAGRLQNDSYALRPALRVGDETKIKVLVQPSQSGADPLTIIEDRKVTDIADIGDFTIAETDKALAADSNADPAVTVTKTWLSNGQIKEIHADSPGYDLDSAYRAAMLTSFEIPDAPVKIGDRWSLVAPGQTDKWRSTHIDYVLSGMDKVGDTNALKVDVNGMETEGPMPASIQGSIWLDPQTFHVLRRVYKETSFPVPGMSNFTGTVTEVPLTSDMTTSTTSMSDPNPVPPNR